MRYKPKDGRQGRVRTAFDEYLRKYVDWKADVRWRWSERERAALDEVLAKRDRLTSIEDLTDLRIGVERIQSERR